MFGDIDVEGGTGKNGGNSQCELSGKHDVLLSRCFLHHTARIIRLDRTVHMSKPLADRIALVTGASRGIGRATALALARDGAHVVAVARTVGGLEEVDDEAREAGSSATLVPLDMRDYGGLYRLAAALNERYQRLDILIGNAAIGGQRSPLDHIEPQAWDELLPSMSPRTCT